MTARSARWNSGRLESISATVSPRLTPSSASPPASASTRSRSSPHVSATSSPFVRTATRSRKSSAVIRNASAIERACSARRETGAAVVAIARPTLPDVEALAGQSSDVVREADEEEHDHEGEADESCPLHHAEGDRAPPHLLGQRPEDVPAVERQEREQVDHPERQRDHREQVEGLGRAELDALPRDLVGADHPGDLLALLGLEDLGDRLDRPAGEEPHLLHTQLGRGGRPDGRARAVEGEAEQGALGAGAVDRLGLGTDQRVPALDEKYGGVGGEAAVARLA